MIKSINFHEVGTVLMVLGTILNSFQIREGFLLWIASNIILGHHEYMKQDKMMTRVFMISLFLAVFGFGFWGLKS